MMKNPIDVLIAAVTIGVSAIILAVCVSFAYAICYTCLESLSKKKEGGNNDR